MVFIVNIVYFFYLFDILRELFWNVQLGFIESKLVIEGRQMIMMLGLNKVVVVKLQVIIQLIINKFKNKKQDNENFSLEIVLSEELEIVLNEELEIVFVVVEI